MVRFTHVKRRLKSDKGVNISHKLRQAKSQQKYQQRQKEQKKKLNKPLKLRFKRSDIDRVLNKQPICDATNHMAFGANVKFKTQPNKNNVALNMDINDIAICDLEQNTDYELCSTPKQPN
eukprot:866895_1